MKKSLIALTLLWTVTASAYTSTEPAKKEYKFKYTYAGETYEIRRTSGSWEEAFDKASSDCFQHFKGGKKVSESKGLDIIDVCANPRS